MPAWTVQSFGAKKIYSLKQQDGQGAKESSGPSTRDTGKIDLSISTSLRLGELSHYKLGARLSGSKAGVREGAGSRMCDQQYPLLM